METLQINEKEITLVKTAHVSKQSVQDVKNAIDLIQPDTVCIELDERRANNLFHKQDYSSMKLLDVIKEKKVILVVVNYILAQYQKRLADQMETQVGDEMRMGVTYGLEQKADIEYIDRDIQVTFKRIWSHLSLWEKIKLTASFIASMFESEGVDEETIEQLKQEDILNVALKEISEEFPTVAEVLVFERDRYMAQSIKEAKGQKIVAVIGAAHAPGIIEQLHKAEIDKKELETIKEPSMLAKQMKWLLPISIIALVLITTGLNFESLTRLSLWLFFAAIAAALGALVWLAHPVTILVSFLTAPIGTLSPILAVGWFAGLSEAYFRKATVGDFNSLNDDVKSFKKILKNNILRTLGIMFTTSLFSSIVTLVFSFDVIRQFVTQLLT